MPEQREEENLSQNDSNEPEFEQQDEQLSENESSQEETSNNDHEDKAKKNGHISKQEWIDQGRDPKKWKSPDDFNAFGDEYKHVKPHIDMLKEELQKSNRRFDIVAKHIEDIKKSEYERGQAELQTKLAIARQVGDMDTAIKISATQRDQEIRRMEEIKAIKQAEVNTADMEFTERNKHWYNDSHPALKDQAIAIGKEIADIYPNITYQELVNKVEKRMSYEHPEIVNRGSAPQKPITSNSSGVNKSQHSSDNMGGREFKQHNLDEKDYNELAGWLKTHAKIDYTKADYIKDLKSRGTL